MMITDGRQKCFESTLASLDALIGLKSFDHAIVVDDGGSHQYSAYLESVHRWDVHVWPSPDGKRGFGGAIQAGWDTLLAMEALNIDYVFHLEDDFVFTRYFSLRWMARLLEQHPNVMQMALMRQPWAPAEIEAGGVVQMHPTEFFQHRDEQTGQKWFSHRLFFSTNPSLYRWSLMLRGWPRGEHSEGAMTAQLLEAIPDCRFGYLGDRLEDPWVMHIGAKRTGTGY